MKLLCAYALGACLTASPAAAWTYSGGTDPMNDKAFAIAAQADADDKTMFGFKCWRGGGAMAMIVLSATPPAGAGSGPPIEVTLRVDRGQPVTLYFDPRDMGAYALVLQDEAADGAAHSLMDDVQHARQTIAVGFGGIVRTYPAEGAARAIRAASERCKGKSAP